MLLGAMTAQGWEPGPGDPSLFGWAVFAGYLAVALLAWRTARREARQGSDPFLWRVLAAGCAALAVNKQLDLHNAVAAVGRSLAKSEGWYLQRRPVQAAFVLLVLAAACVATTWMLRRADGGWRRHRLTLAGLIALVTFVVVRAASFHHVDALLGLQLGGVRVHAALELAGIALLAAAAWHVARRPIARDAR